MVDLSCGYRSHQGDDDEHHDQRRRTHEEIARCLVETAVAAIDTEIGRPHPGPLVVGHRPLEAEKGDRPCVVVSEFKRHRLGNDHPGHAPLHDRHRVLLRRVLETVDLDSGGLLLDTEDDNLALVDRLRHIRVAQYPHQIIVGDRDAVTVGQLLVHRLVPAPRVPDVEDGVGGDEQVEGVEDGHVVVGDDRGKGGHVVLGDRVWPAVIHVLVATAEDYMVRW